MATFAERVVSTNREGETFVVEECGGGKPHDQALFSTYRRTEKVRPSWRRKTPQSSSVQHRPPAAAKTSDFSPFTQTCSRLTALIFQHRSFVRRSAPESFREPRDQVVSSGA
ncbi:3-ketoacyl-acyl carrier protein synthase I [Striga asiatica]|uniref:3-ketoacyl-acyl carrier protein synthase I n=1 Tax=Striga asiatica TaxID=4170 RepID=A0A5A7PU56_STRAF|nr:3-ketoacyl-acyl carrier protein synthase I [Striga asiatica]